jgi:hypothetical protein
MICAKTAAWLEKEIDIKDEKQFQMLGENIKKNHIFGIVAYPAFLYKWDTIIVPQTAWLTMEPTVVSPLPHRSNEMRRHTI